MSLFNSLRRLKSKSYQLDPKNIFHITTNPPNVTIKNDKLLKAKTMSINQNIFQQYKIEDNTKLEDLIIDYTKTYFTNHPILPLYLKAYLLSLPEKKLIDINQMLLLEGCSNQCKSDIIKDLLTKIVYLKDEDKKIVTEIFLNIGGTQESTSRFLTNNDVMGLNIKNKNALKEMLTDHRRLSTKYQALSRYGMTPIPSAFGGGRRKTNIRKHKTNIRKNKRKTQKHK